VLADLSITRQRRSSGHVGLPRNRGGARHEEGASSCLAAGTPASRRQTNIVGPGPPTPGCAYVYARRSYCYVLSRSHVACGGYDAVLPMVLIRFLAEALMVND